MKKSEDNIFALFSKNEKLIGQLYEIYAQKFLSDREVWQNISNEEKEHSKILADLSARDIEDKKALKLNRYAYDVIDYVSQFVRKKIKEAKTKSLDRIKALEIGLRIERSMIENKDLKMFIPRSPEVLAVFKKLNHESQKHLETFEKELGKI